MDICSSAVPDVAARPFIRAHFGHLWTTAVTHSMQHIVRFLSVYDEPFDPVLPDYSLSRDRLWLWRWRGICDGGGVCGTVV